MASVEGAIEKFRVVCRTAAYYDVTFFKFQGGGTGALLLVPPPAGAHAHGYRRCTVLCVCLE